MASTSPPLKRIHPSTTTIETDPSRSHDVDDENISKKSRLLSSHESSLDHASPSSSQPQSSAAPSLLPPSPLLQFKPIQLVDDGQSHKGFLAKSEDSYISPDFIKAHKLSSSQVANKGEFFEHCLIKLHQNDPTLLSLDINCQSIGEHEIIRFIEALAINSTLLELSIIFQQLTKVVASHLVEALNANSTLTRLSLNRNRIAVNAKAQLSDLLRCNTTLLSLDLSRTELTENGITHLCEALSVNTTLTHLDLHCNVINEAASTQLCRVLTVNSILTVLDLRYCRLKETGLIQLSEALARNYSLTRLEIGDNTAISMDTKESIMQRLFYNRLQRSHLPSLFQNDPKLTSLYLSSQWITRVDMTRLSEALAVSSVLTELSLGSVGPPTFSDDPITKFHLFAKTLTSFQSLTS